MLMLVLNELLQGSNLIWHVRWHASALVQVSRISHVWNPYLYLNFFNLNYFVNSTFHFWRFHRIMTIFYMLLIQLSCGKTVEGCFCPVRERIYNICESLWEEKDVGQINLARKLAPLSLRQNLSRTDSFCNIYLCIFSLQNSSFGVGEYLTIKRNFSANLKSRVLIQA